MIDFGRDVSLGPLDYADKEIIRGWRNDPAIWKWCRQNDVISDMDQDRWIEAQSLSQTTKMYMIHAEGWLKVGVCGLTSIDPINRRAEFSLYIAPTQQGIGFGRKALATLLDHGFKNLGLHSIWGESFAGNPAIRMFGSLGFKNEGARRDFYFRDGKFIDAYLCSILASEWIGALSIGVSNGGEEPFSTSSWQGRAAAHNYESHSQV